MIYLGTSEFAADVLERLVAGGIAPALVVTRPDRPSGRGRRLNPPPVALAAAELGLMLTQPERVNDPEARAEIARAGGSVAERQTVVVCAFGALIREPLLSEHEMLNVHPSLLPRWRGAAPIERAIMAGDEQTGVCVMLLEEGLDSGPVFARAGETIGPHDTYGTLSARLAALGAELLVGVLERRPTPMAQPEQGVTYADKIAPSDRLLDSARPAVELERTVRALSPHIGARLALSEQASLGVRRATLSELAAPAGHLVAEQGRLLLGCSPGSLELLEVVPAGGRAMDGGSYLRGHELPQGRL